VKEMKGDIIYLSNPINQFSAFTNKAHQLKSEGALYVSADYLESKGLSEGDEIEVKTANGDMKVKIELDKQLSGDIAYLPTFDTNLNSAALFKDGYRFTTATMRKV
jgi:NADH-quinone oxidoreductase subunit G